MNLCDLLPWAGKECKRPCSLIGVIGRAIAVSAKCVRPGRDIGKRNAHVALPVGGADERLVVQSRGD